VVLSEKCGGTQVIRTVSAAGSQVAVGVPGRGRRRVGAVRDLRVAHDRQKESRSRAIVQGEPHTKARFRDP
jgi:hypothetical protein